ncbi:MAG: CBS domain-containing protein [Thermoplasmata archaeon]
MSVENVMTREVISVKATSKLKDAWLILMEADISGAPVVDDSGNVVGVLSATDIYRAITDRIQRAKSLREATMQLTEPNALEKEEVRELTLAIRAVAESTVQSILPKEQKLLALAPDDSLDRAIRLMAEHNVNRLPVVKEGRVEGIITRQDIIWLLAGRPGKG